MKNKLRKQALEWWNNLLFIQKDKYYDIYQSNCYTTASYYSQLIGYEIQKIWAVETEREERIMVIDDKILGKKIVEYAKPFEGTGKYNDILLAIEFGYHLNNK